MDNNANRADMSPTPFDDVFKTECEKLKPFLVPLIKEIFGLECTIEEMPQYMERLMKDILSMVQRQ